MADRKVAVRLTLETTQYLREARQAADATDRLSAEVSDLDAGTRRLVASFQETTKGVRRFNADSVDVGRSIDRLSGRMRLLAEVAGGFGPALVPITTAATPAIAGLTSALGAAVLGAGVAVTAFQGVGDALEAVNKAQLEPTAENLAAANAAMEQLAPAAREAVRAMQGWRPVLTDIRDAAAGGFFPGFVDGLKELEVLAPQVERLFGRVGLAAGDIFERGAAGLAGAEGREFIDFIEREAAPTLTRFGTVTGNVAAGVGDLIMAMDPLSDDLLGGIVSGSESFAAWADGLSQTEGYREFVEYVRLTGPQVVETVGALTRAVLEIGEAAAPLGGPILQGVEAFADAVAVIADSPLGTPIMAAVTAMSALSLATKAFGTVAATSWAQAARGQAGYIASLRGANGAMAQMSAARSGVRAAGVGAAAIGAGAMGMQYTALGAVAGSVIPGIGTAAGAASGALLDMTTALSRADKAAREWDEALASGDVSQIEQALEGKRDAIKDLEEGHWGLKDAFDALASGSPYRDQMYREEAEAEEALAQATEEAARAQGYASEETRRRVSSMQALHDAVLAEMNAELGWEQAMLDATTTVAENGRVVDRAGNALKGHEQAAIDSKREVNGLIAAWNDQVRTGDATAKQMDETKAAVRRLAAQMGLGESETRRLIRAMDAIPPKKKTTVEVATEQAMGELGAFAALYRSIQSKTVTITTQYAGYGSDLDNLMLGPMGKKNPADGGTIPVGGGSPRRAAMGATVPDDGGGYFDKYLYALAPLEEVISNRHGQAEEFRPELKAINAGASRAEVISLMARGLADGGTVRGLANGGTARRGDDTDGVRELGRAARETAKEMRAAARAERERIRDLKKSLVDTVSDKFRSNIFENDNPWSDGGDWRSKLREETAQANRFARDARTLKKKGVKGESLDYLLANADPSMVRGFAGMTKTELAEYSRLYNARERAASTAGRSAGNAAYGAQLKAIERQLDRLNQRIGKSAEETGRAVGREINGAARNGARRGGR